MRAPLRMLGHVGLGAAEILRRVHGQPDARVTEPTELALGGELRERALLVVALLRQAVERLLAEDVDAGVHPLLEERRLAEAGDRAVVVQVDDAERRANLRTD